MDKIGRVPFLLISLLFLGSIIIFSCSPKQKSNSTMSFQEMDGALPSVEPMESVEYIPTQESIDIPLINSGAINITNNLNIRDIPSTKGNVLRQSSFGEHFNIYEKRGSGNIENGVMDLWYRVSDGEWINALYLRTFPFYIASDSTRTFRNEFKLNNIIIKIEGYRELNGKKELKVNITAHTGFIFHNEIMVTTKDLDQSIELLDEYTVDPHNADIITKDDIRWDKYDEFESRFIREDCNVKFIDNQFDNLRNYSLELEEIVQKYGERFNYQYNFTEVEQNMKVFSFHDQTNDIMFEITNFETFIVDYFSDDGYSTLEWEKIMIKIDRLSNIVLNGVNIRNRKDDIILQFGNSFSITEEYTYNEILVEHITYYLCKYNNPYIIEFILSGGRVQQIVYSQLLRGGK
jgi:hypothetical protein